MGHGADARAFEPAWRDSFDAVEASPPGTMRVDIPDVFLTSVGIDRYCGPPVPPLSTALACPETAASLA